MFDADEIIKDSRILELIDSWGDMNRNGTWYGKEESVELTRQLVEGVNKALDIVKSQLCYDEEKNGSIEGHHHLPKLKWSFGEWLASNYGIEFIVNEVCKKSGFDYVKALSVCGFLCGSNFTGKSFELEKQRYFQQKKKKNVSNTASNNALVRHQPTNELRKNIQTEYWGNPEFGKHGFRQRFAVAKDKELSEGLAEGEDPPVSYDTIYKWLSPKKN